MRTTTIQRRFYRLAVGAGLKPAPTGFSRHKYSVSELVSNGPIAPTFGLAFRRDRVKRIGRINQMIEHQPQASRVMKKHQREDHRERYPERELLVNVHLSKCVEHKKTGNGDQHCCGIVNVNRADKITLLAFELESTLRAVGMHPECFGIQCADAAARASKT